MDVWAWDVLASWEPDWLEEKSRINQIIPAAEIYIYMYMHVVLTKHCPSLCVTLPVAGCVCAAHVCTHWGCMLRLPTTYQGTWDNNNLDIVVWTRKIPWVPKSIWLSFSIALNDGRRIIPRIILQWIFTGCLTKTKRQHTVLSCFSCYIYS